MRRGRGGGRGAQTRALRVTSPSARLIWYVHKVGEPRLGGRWELGPAIGSGGFATVFRSRDPERDVAVAVKLVPALMGSTPPQARRLLQHEAEVLRRLDSRHVARVLDCGEDEHGAWLVTELVEGGPLDTRTFGRALFPHEVLRVARGLLEGLMVAHRAGVIHGDIKASNVLVPRTPDALDQPKLIDFGLARVIPRAAIARELGAPAPEHDTWGAGNVVGSITTMAPEVLRGADPSFTSDVYGAGLVLFDLLGVGELFDGAGAGERLRLRMRLEPNLGERVPEPLSEVLARMLARDPERRFRDAAEAYDAVIELDTAPVSLAPEDPSRSMPPSRISAAPNAIRSRSPLPPPRMSLMPSADVPRLRLLPASPPDALFETLRHFDLAMLDALARRERGNSFGRIARACALTLRLELDAGALILEPLNLQNDVARAASAGLLAPRARRVTRARVDTDRDDAWASSAPPELAGLFVAIAIAIGQRDDAARDIARATRVEARIERAADSPDAEARRLDDLLITVRFARTAASVRRGDLDPATALDRISALETTDIRRLPLDRWVRAMTVASIASRTDSARAQGELDRAQRIAGEAGATLFEVAASALLGRLLADVPVRSEQALERASTLLAHGDAPSLEHEAQHHRAASLVAGGRFDDAIPFLRAAREAAHAERAVELEALSASYEVIAHLATGSSLAAKETVASLGDARLASLSGRTAAMAWLARCLDLLSDGDIEAARKALDAAKVRGTDAGDILVVVEVLGLVFDVARGTVTDMLGPASELEAVAAQRGFASFHWFDVLSRIFEQLEPAVARGMSTTLGRLTVLFGPSSRMARRTTMPPASTHSPGSPRHRGVP